MLRIAISPNKPTDVPPVESEATPPDTPETAVPEPKQAYPKFDLDKVSPEVAGYKQGGECEHCIHFEAPNACAVVSGDIDPHWTCNLWEPGNDQETDADANSDETQEPLAPEMDMSEEPNI